MILDIRWKLLTLPLIVDLIILIYFVLFLFLSRTSSLAYSTSSQVPTRTWSTLSDTVLHPARPKGGLPLSLANTKAISNSLSILLLSHSLFETTLNL